MKKSIIAIVLIQLIILIGCSKGDGGSTTPPTEPNITFDVDASSANINPGSTFNFNVKLTSAMPSSQGIKIDISASEEVTGNSVSPQNPTTTSTSATTPVSVINLPQQKWVVTTVKVSSVATPTNNATKTFRVVYK
jgi:hypothetical protein